MTSSISWVEGSITKMSFPFVRSRKKRAQEDNKIAFDLLIESSSHRLIMSSLFMQTPIPTSTLQSYSSFSLLNTSFFSHFVSFSKEHHTAFPPGASVNLKPPRSYGSRVRKSPLFPSTHTRLQALCKTKLLFLGLRTLLLVSEISI